MQETATRVPNASQVGELKSVMAQVSDIRTMLSEIRSEFDSLVAELPNPKRLTEMSAEEVIAATLTLSEEERSTYEKVIELKREKSVLTRKLSAIENQIPAAKESSQQMVRQLCVGEHIGLCEAVLQASEALAAALRDEREFRECVAAECGGRVSHPLQQMTTESITARMDTWLEEHRNWLYRYKRSVPSG